MNIIQRLTLDVARDGIQANLIMVQGERGARSLVISLRNGSQTVALDHAYGAALKGVKPDGGELFNSCVVYTKDGVFPNAIVYHVTEGTVAAAGSFTVRLMVWNKIGETLYSPEFSITVKANERLDNEDVPKDEFTAFIQAMAEAQATAKQIEAKTQEVFEEAARIDKVAEEAKSEAAAAKSEAQTARELVATVQGEAEEAQRVIEEKLGAIDADFEAKMSEANELVEELNAMRDDLEDAIAGGAW